MYTACSLQYYLKLYHYRIRLICDRITARKGPGKQDFVSVSQALGTSWTAMTASVLFNALQTRFNFFLPTFPHRKAISLKYICALNTVNTLISLGTCPFAWLVSSTSRNTRAPEQSVRVAPFARKVKEQLLNPGVSHIIRTEGRRCSKKLASLCSPKLAERQVLIYQKLRYL